MSTSARLGAVLAACLAVLAAAAAVGAKAGKISALLPAARIERGAGAGAATLEARRGAEVLANDLVRTDKQGRVRINLLDHSILSIGVNSELRIVNHDPHSHQTALELRYGLLRAQVSKLVAGGRLSLATPTAVAGVIGTDFGVDASKPDETKFICMAGEVQLTSSDPNIPGTVICRAGTTVIVRRGHPPEVPQPATEQQMEKWKRITEPEEAEQYEATPY
jgi:hypothetical protein